MLLTRRLRLDYKRIPHGRVVVQHADGAFAVARGIAVQGQLRHIAVVVVQLVDMLVTGVAAFDAFPLEAYLAAVIAHVHLVGSQVGVGKVVDFDLGMPVGLQLARAVEVVGLHGDIAAADGDVRDFRVTDGIAAGDIGPDSVGVPIGIRHGLIGVHVLFVHLIIDALALGNIAIVCGSVVAVAVVVLGDQLVQHR